MAKRAAAGCRYVASIVDRDVSQEAGRRGYRYADEAHSDGRQDALVESLGFDPS